MSGTIPDYVAALTKLITDLPALLSLDLSLNYLSGALNYETLRLSSNLEINLDSNQFSGLLVGSNAAVTVVVSAQNNAFMCPLPSAPDSAALNATCVATPCAEGTVGLYGVIECEPCQARYSYRSLSLRSLVITTSLITTSLITISLIATSLITTSQITTSLLLSPASTATPRGQKSSVRWCAQVVATVPGNLLPRTLARLEPSAKPQQSLKHAKMDAVAPKVSTAAFCILI